VFADVSPNGQAQIVLGWRDTRYGPVSSVEAQTGYWVWSDRTVGTLLYGLPVTGALQLGSGWSLVGVPRPVPLSQCPEILIAWWWDLAIRSYRQVPRDGELLPGRGYWILTSAPCSLGPF